MRSRHLLFVCLLCAVVLPASASGAVRMLVGFQDDPSFRWRADRSFVLDRARDHNATILRTTVYWSKIAPTRPAIATNSTDPVYQFDDLDEFVRGATTRGIEVMLTIWGTPGWANGGKGQNFAPSRMADLTAFAQAVASRYSGHNAGLPFVRYYTIWNESNLGQFLSPQYTPAGKPAAPFIYAQMYRAAYAGIKAGNPRALIGIGETSARGRDKPLKQHGLQETESPGHFAQLLATVRPRLRFDAWSQHPYPTALRQKPLANVRWPNVTLAQLPHFEESIDTWFGRKNIPIWITEYGYQTQPPEPGGVTYAQQAAYLRQAINYARSDERVQMFIWFILRDDPTSTWQSGLLNQSGFEKPSSNVFGALAKLLDARDPIVTLKQGVMNPVVRIPVLEFEGRDGPGGPVFSTVRAYVGSKLVGVSQPTGTVTIDGLVALPVPISRTAAKTRYTVTFQLADQHGNQLFRTAAIYVS